MNFPHDERVATVFRPGLHVGAEVQTVPQGPDDVVERGHGASATSRGRSRSATRRRSRRPRACRRRPSARAARVYGPGTAIPHRADFNTLDNPFFWSAQPASGRHGRHGPAAGVHFVVFNPSSDDFNRGRLAMDGVLPDGTKLPFAPRDRGQGFNSILRTTHRQNFLVPPRRHRSFPLVELLRVIRRAGPEDAEAVVRIFRESRAEAMPWLPVLHDRRRGCSGGSGARVETGDAYVFEARASSRGTRS